MNVDSVSRRRSSDPLGPSQWPRPVLAPWSVSTSWRRLAAADPRRPVPVPGGASSAPDGSGAPARRMDVARRTHERPQATAAAVTVYGDLGSFDDGHPRARSACSSRPLSYTTGRVRRREAEGASWGTATRFGRGRAIGLGTCWWVRIDGRDVSRSARVGPVLLGGGRAGRRRALLVAGSGPLTAADTSCGMGDTFCFIAPVMPRRRVDPLALRAAVRRRARLALFGGLGAFVVSQEHAADERRAALAAQAAADHARAGRRPPPTPATAAVATRSRWRPAAAADDALAVRDVWTHPGPQRGRHRPPSPARHRDTSSSTDRRRRRAS